jgi:hypothetical protein
LRSTIPEARAKLQQGFTALRELIEKGEKVMSELNIKGDGFYLNANKRKDKDTHPDFVGYLKLTPQQLAGLIEIYERSRANNEDPVLQIDVGGMEAKKG